MLFIVALRVAIGNLSFEEVVPDVDGGSSADFDQGGSRPAAASWALAVVSMTTTWVVVGASVRGIFLILVRYE